MQNNIAASKPVEHVHVEAAHVAIVGFHATPRAVFGKRYETCKIYSKVVSNKASSNLLLIHNLNATAAVRVCVAYWGLVFG